ncbi:hypothetical protein OC845_005681 [Tilletia horrida]|nr:hypothetical protein OC845_005681 [Tilletia horrida]
MFSLKSTSLVLAFCTLAARTALAASAGDFPPLSPLVRADLEKRDPASYEVFHERSNLTRRAALNGYQTRCTTHACFSFTFDDGPYSWHTKIADEIASIGTHATFFVNGNNYQCIYDKEAVAALKYSYSRGHQICSHTWSHPDIMTLSRAQLDKQVTLVEDALYKILGVVPACIRPPYGSIDDATVKYLNDKHGLVVVGWTGDEGDTKDADGASVSYSLNQYRKLKAPKHVIMLNHETVPTTSSKVIPQAIHIVQDNGYQPQYMGTVSETLGFAPYKVKGTPGKRDSTWTCAGKPQPGNN